MEFHPLTETTLESLVHCLNASFAGYFVPMPTDVEFWRTRFENARVNWGHSWGAFEDGNLVGFVVNAIDHKNGVLTAYNSGTGVLPEYRRQRLVDQLYGFGLEALSEFGVEQCTLEVIDKNVRALKVYERIGFEITTRLHCYKGKLEATDLGTRIQQVECSELRSSVSDAHYSWDNTFTTIIAAGSAYQAYFVYAENVSEPIGFFIINPSNGYLAQLESNRSNLGLSSTERDKFMPHSDSVRTTNHCVDGMESAWGDWECIFDGVRQICDEIRINNVPAQRKKLLTFLNDSPLVNTVDQLDMRRVI